MLVDQPSRHFKSEHFQRDMDAATEDYIVLS